MVDATLKQAGKVVGELRLHQPKAHELVSVVCRRDPADQGRHGMRLFQPKGWILIAGCGIRCHHSSKFQKYQKQPKTFEILEGHHLTYLWGAGRIYVRYLLSLPLLTVCWVWLRSFHVELNRAFWSPDFGCPPSKYPIRSNTSHATSALDFNVPGKGVGTKRL